VVGEQKVGTIQAETAVPAVPSVHTLTKFTGSAKTAIRNSLTPLTVLVMPPRGSHRSWNAPLWFDVVGKKTVSEADLASNVSASANNEKFSVLLLYLDGKCYDDSWCKVSSYHYE